ncbi:MAG: 4-(cytidine 5'-diphospho)-2-C-methyl-D-erythritol kinase [Neisseria sp.]|nr:4-(cytidine 5'-diphospho)-2-C-methyl-D-erythritol kinase [Neisseria sp.]
MNLFPNARAFPAPAKLNLDLRITGRRADGYHELESIFCLIDLQDTVYIAVRADNQIVLHNPIEGVPAECDLTVRAARALQEYCGIGLGADIGLRKRIPMGGGLGGGSSDAATVLLVLNRLWNCRLQTAQLIDIGIKLGADIPFFLFGRNAFARGIGERLQEIAVPEQWYVVLRPNVHIETARIFAHKHLTRDSKPSIMPTFHSLQPFRNDMQAVVLQEYPVVARAFEDLKRYGKPLMTGSGSCLFLCFPKEEEARVVCKEVSKTYQAFYVKGLCKHPLLGK